MASGGGPAACAQQLVNRRTPVGRVAPERGSGSPAVHTQHRLIALHRLDSCPLSLGRSKKEPMFGPRALCMVLVTGLAFTMQCGFATDLGVHRHAGRMCLPPAPYIARRMGLRPTPCLETASSRPQRAWRPPPPGSAWRDGKHVQASPLRGDTRRHATYRRVMLGQTGNADPAWQ